MSKNEIYIKIRPIFAEKLMVDEEELEMETDVINGLCPDSLVITEIIMEIEDEFGLAIADGELNGLDRICDLVDYLHEKLAFAGR